MNNRYLEKMQKLIYFARECLQMKLDFTFEDKKLESSDRALQTAQEIRQAERESAMIIHGVMQRSGTVYVGELMRLHPDLYAYPNEIWEIPFLRFIDKIIDFQKDFLQVYPQNRAKIGEHDFLPLFGSAFIDYLYSWVPEGKRMLLKVPNVQYLNYFFSVFPYESLIILLRDGRDVVSSTLKTWPERQFSEVCYQWSESIKMSLGFDAYYRDRSERYLMVKYEDILDNPVDFIKQTCDRFNLDYKKYPFEKIKELPVRGSSSIKQEGKTTWEPVEKPINFKPTARWQEWSTKQKRTFKKIAGQTLIDAGYSNNLDW
jgi:hypothetical protein